MTTMSTPVRVDISSYEGKPTLMRLLRQEYARTLAMLEAADEADFNNPTPCEAWRVRELAGHLLDVAISYSGYFRHARNEYAGSEPLGMRVYARELEQSAHISDGSDKNELLARMDSQVDALFTTFEELTEEEWTGKLIPHKYVGPVPAFMMATFQLMDYSVHNWDFEVALGHEAQVDEECANTLVPYMFGLWQICFDAEAAAKSNLTIGVELTSSPVPDHWTVNIADGSFAFAPGEPTDADATFSFSAKDFCLDAYQRGRKGETDGDPAAIEKFRSMFFTV